METHENRRVKPRSNQMVILPPQRKQEDHASSVLTSPSLYTVSPSPTLSPSFQHQYFCQIDLVQKKQ
ncbi:hypothetical protein MJO28_015426 [Puccinia striiformis f. sp. tritici]|uniref:Uncharacterized protein n=1 Tax=Puccinia striiformis f. sp. tritici TaxID=168172 RepID=A0ACC0DT70_9BASI|nr:hypothetical protein MJO28_015426 [Puccinia striiformis f. sp. tritici]